MVELDYTRPISAFAFPACKNYRISDCGQVDIVHTRLMFQLMVGCNMQKLIIGLGNPGEEYEKSRHNVGFMVIDHLSIAMNSGLWKKNEKVDASVDFRKPLALLAKPLTFMNESGKTVKKIFKYYKFENVGQLVVIHDDLDLPLGSYRIQKGHGPMLHKGVNSIELELGSEWFTRVRIGIDNRDPEKRVSGERYVLENFSKAETEVLNKIIEKIVIELIDLISVSKTREPVRH